MIPEYPYTACINHECAYPHPMSLIDKFSYLSGDMGYYECPNCKTQLHWMPFEREWRATNYKVKYYKLNEQLEWVEAE